MSSSEERERGLQFFGGTSAGGMSNRHRIAPYFDTESIQTNVTVSDGSSLVHLPCRVKQLGERTVSCLLMIFLFCIICLTYVNFLLSSFTAIMDSKKGSTNLDSR